MNITPQMQQQRDNVLSQIASMEIDEEFINQINDAIICAMPASPCAISVEELRAILKEDQDDLSGISQQEMEKRVSRGWK